MPPVATVSSIPNASSRVMHFGCVVVVDVDAANAAASSPTDKGEDVEEDDDSPRRNFVFVVVFVKPSFEARDAEEEEEEETSSLLASTEDAWWRRKRIINRPAETKSRREMPPLVLVGGGEEDEETIIAVLFSLLSLFLLLTQPQTNRKEERPRSLENSSHLSLSLKPTARANKYITRCLRVLLLSLYLNLFLLMSLSLFFKSLSSLPRALSPPPGPRAFRFDSLSLKFL